MAGLLFRMFRVDRTEVRGTMQGEPVLLEMGDFRTELAMQILMRHQYLNKDNVFQAETMFMGNLSSADPIYVEAGPS
ncbi:hypothetical protein Tco_0070465 [Tanacetum coccineum]